MKNRDGTYDWNGQTELYDYGEENMRDRMGRVEVICGYGYCWWAKMRVL